MKSLDKIQSGNKCDCRHLFYVCIIIAFTANVAAAAHVSPLCPNIEIIECLNVDTDRCSATPCAGTEICCATECNGTQCQTAPEQKAGTCPVLKDVVPDGPGGCATLCVDDSGCPGVEKCCKSDCGGADCTTPDGVVKQGECPAVTAQCPPFTGEQCTKDSECAKKRKCCDTEACMGKQCTDITVPLSPDCPVVEQQECFVKDPELCNSATPCQGSEICCKTVCDGTMCQPVPVTNTTSSEQPRYWIIGVAVGSALVVLILCCCCAWLMGNGKGAQYPRVAPAVAPANVRYDGRGSLPNLGRPPQPVAWGAPPRQYGYY